MSTNVYNIVWADDEIDTLKDRYEERFNDNGFEIIGIAHDGKELQAVLSRVAHKADAVIVDANFPHEAACFAEGLNERNISGLDYAHSLYAFSYGHEIPFFLFTQRSDELLREELCQKPDFLNDFQRHKRWFKKNDEEELDEMFDAIKKEVEHRNSDSFRIRNKYKKEFEAAKLIDGATENLERGLLYLYEEDSWKDIQDYFNPARKIAERIKRSCVEMNLLPPHISLNIASKMFSMIDCGYSLKERIMEKPLAESFHFFLKITQDGSHDAEELPLGVDQYVRKSKNINLYRSILYIAMDLLLWHKQIREKYADKKERLWNSSFTYEGKARMLPNGRFYTNKYLLDTKEVDIKDGDWVGIFESKPCTHPQGNITEFVFKTKYVILERSDNTILKN